MGRLLDLHNALLAYLPQQVRDRWLAQASMTELRKGCRLTLDRTPSSLVLFPLTCVAAMSASSMASERVFVRFTGCTSAVGIANLFRSGGLSFHGEIVGAGEALAVPTRVVEQDLQPLVRTSGLAAALLSRVASRGLLINACVTSHEAAARLARILLEASDSFGEQRDITLSHQLLAQFLGVRRETITFILTKWQASGALQARRGTLQIIDHAYLLAQSCECYEQIKRFDESELMLWRGLDWGA